MNRTDMVKMVANQADVPQVVTSRVIDAFCEAVTLSLSCGEPVNIRGFGKWHALRRRATTRKNPRTGIAMSIPPTISVGFIAGSELRTRLNDEGV